MRVGPQNRISKLLLFTLMVILPSLAGCPNAPLCYDLQRWGATTVLVPPNRRSTNENSGLLISNFKNARRKSSSGTRCDTEGPVVALHWHGKAVEVRVKAESYVAERTEGSQSQGEVSGMYLDPLQDIGTFHTQLLQLESKGCFDSVEARRIRRAVAERFPLPPSIAYRYQLGSYDTTGFIELTPDFRLNVVTPIYDGESQTLENQIGYEIAYYNFAPAAGDARVAASLTSVAEFRPGQPETLKTTSRNRMDFPTSPNYFHVAFKTEKTSARHVTRAFLLSSADALQLDAGTKQLQATSVDTCEAVSTSSVKCIGFPQNFGVSAELRVRVNHKEVFVQLDGIVLDALGLPSLSVPVPRHLRVTRLFQGRRVPIAFDPTKKDILALTLMPGDEITW
jgi:hypothetical protein